MGPEERFTTLRMSAACVQLSREQVSELVAITAKLFEERKRICRLLAELPESFREVRQILNELARTVRSSDDRAPVSESEPEAGKPGRDRDRRRQG